jgi:sugar phosphate isomerase/epimerase
MTAPPWPLAAFLTSQPLDFPAAVAEAAALGFTHVDVVALIDRPPAHLEALADAGALVGCAALGRDLPPGCTLDAPDVELRRNALQLVRRQVSDAARLGATHAYLVPGTERTPEALAYFAESCALLADHAAGCMVRLCVEHVPGRALPDAAAALDWLQDINHANLGLLLDVGHCLISGEDPAEVVRRAGPLLGHVHLDDNDGVGDLHWPLLTGRLTEKHLADVANALREIGYRGGLALELNPRNDDPAGALREGRAVVGRFFGGSAAGGGYGRN